MKFFQFPADHQKLLLVAVLIVVLFLPTASQAHVTVLLYHKFDETDSPSTSISSKLFRDQMETLRAGDYQVLSMAELEDCLYGRRRLPKRAAVITIDDGYISEYDKAVPILREYGYPFTIFVFTNAVGRSGYMSWEQLREVHAYGGSVGCHSHTHPHLTDIPIEQARREILLSKGVLEKNLGRPVKWFALPFGDYDQKILMLGREAGFTVLLTSDPGTVGPSSRPERVPRQAIVGSNLTMDLFREKLDRLPLEVVECYPEPGRLTDAALDRIMIRLAHPGDFYPDQVQVFISEKGRIAASFDPQTGMVTVAGPINLSRKTNRISVTARRKADSRYARHSYLVVLPENN